MEEHVETYLSTGSEYPSMIAGDAELEETPKKKSLSKLPHQENEHLLFSFSFFLYACTPLSLRNPVMENRGPGC